MQNFPGENWLAFSCLFCTCLELSSLWPVAIPMQTSQPKFAYKRRAQNWTWERGALPFPLLYNNGNNTLKLLIP